MYKINFLDIRKIVVFTSAALMTIGCSEEFVIDEDNSSISSDIVFNSDGTALAAVTGVYDGFQNDSQGDPGLPNEYNVKGIFAMANYPTVDFQVSTRRSENDFFNFDVNPDGDEATKIWPNNYRQIGRANIALEGLRQSLESGGGLSEDLANRLIGEVLVLRAISYQYLTATYGDVPLVLSTSDDPFKGRDSENTIYQQIITDMEAAIQLLPWPQDPERGRVTRGTAYAVLGNAHMWLGQYSDAVTAFEAIEGGGVTALESSYLNIHALGNPNGVESLFELQWAANGDLSWGRNDEVNILQLFSMPTDITGGGGFAGIPTQELWESFEPGDTRRVATVIGPGEEHPDPLIDISMYDGVEINTLGTVEDPWTGAPAGEAESDQRTGYWGIKGWRDPSIEGWGRTILFGGQGHIWIRYGEVLLSLAEAALKDGQTATAQAALDRVRARAFEGSAPPMTATMENILQEYRHELAGEFSLWPVIRRSGMAREFLMANYGINIPEGRDLLPLPNAVLSTNPNLEQNPSY